MLTYVKKAHINNMKLIYKPNQQEEVQISYHVFKLLLLRQSIEISEIYQLSSLLMDVIQIMEKINYNKS